MDEEKQESCACVGPIGYEQGNIYFLNSVPSQFLIDKLTIIPYRSMIHYVIVYHSDVNMPAALGLICAGGMLVTTYLFGYSCYGELAT